MSALLGHMASVPTHDGLYGQRVMRPEYVADYLLTEARNRGEVLTNLKLQKLLYYAQAWHLALYEEALFAEDFEAWVHGPVLPSQYHRFKSSTWEPIMDDIQAPQLHDRIAKHLDEILSVFGTDSAIALEAMTHAEQPWRDARGRIPPDEPSYAVISKETMRRFYRSL